MEYLVKGNCGNFAYLGFRDKYPSEYECVIEIPEGAVKFFVNNEGIAHFISLSGQFMADYDIKNGKGYWYNPAVTMEYYQSVMGGTLVWQREKVEVEVDNVNHPKHYTGHPSGIECIEITRHHDFAIGNAIKYLWRAGLKDSNNEIQDLEKAVWYIQDKIKQLKGE